MANGAPGAGLGEKTTTRHVAVVDNADIRRRNVRALIEEHGAAAVANTVGISPSQLSQIAGVNPTRAIGPSLARRIEEKFNKSRGWIDVLHDPVNLVSAPIGGRRIPVLSYAQAGAPTAVIDAHEPGYGIDELETDIPVGENAFALEIRGNSMEPDFVEGDRVIIDPAVRPQPGDFVVARCNEIEATFKKYRPRGIDSEGRDIFELVPLNDDYPIIRSEQHPIVVVGTMVEHRRYRKRK